MSKHILIVHGFLLSGTGSNIYSCNVAMQWKKQNHAITIFCQDPDAGTYDWVDEFYTKNDELPKEQIAPGKVRVILPDIADLLPVYQYDDYKGYTTKTIPNFTDEEIERHINMMAKAVKDVCTRWKVDKVLSNHALLQPINVKRGLEGLDIPFDIKIHGSAITFILKKFPKYMPYAVEAIEASNKVIAGTLHVVDQVLSTFPDMDLSKKLVIVPPGMDPDVFDLCTSIDTNSKKFLQLCEKHVNADGTGRDASKVTLPEKGDTTQDFHNKLVEMSKDCNQRVVDSDILKKFPTIAEDEPVLIFFGKFLYTKGIGEILMTFPTMVKKYPKMRLILVGFGIYREHIEIMIRSMVTGDKELFKSAAHCVDELGCSFLESSVDIDQTFQQLDQEQADRILVTGCLNHKELGLLLPMASISLVTSKAAEAFGMVSVEAMSAGVLPLCVYHSGIKDVLDKLKETEPELEDLLHLPVESGGDYTAANGAHLIKILPERVFAALEYLYPSSKSCDDQLANRREVGQKLRKVACDVWSWDGICTTLANL